MAEHHVEAGDVDESEEGPLHEYDWAVVVNCRLYRVGVLNPLVPTIISHKLGGLEAQATVRG